ncbi:cyclophilin-like fold protein [Flavobacterium maritimum]|uniref:cyclophilin-like fold protein n=1 Tax=Flavobacterium maritimum TaxID=3149042 RepID=UPI0032B45586
MMKQKATACLITFCIAVTSLFACNTANKGARSSDTIAINENYKMDSLQLKITVGKSVLYAKFTDSKATQDFIKQLPLTVTMMDLKGREKYCSLSGISKEGTVKTTFQVGDISYWLGGGLAIFYNQDNSTIKAGLIVLARLENGIDALNGSDSVVVKLEAIKK